MAKKHHHRINIGNVFKQIGHGIETVGKKTIVPTINHVYHTVSHEGNMLVDKSFGLVKSKTSTLKWPLMIGGVIVLFILISKK